MSSEVRQKLYNIRLQSRESYLKLMGIEMEKVRVLEKRVDAQYEELSKVIQRDLQKAGEETSKKQKASLVRTIASFNKNIETAIDRPQMADMADIGKLHYCPCIYPFTASRVDPPSDSINLDPPSGEGAEGAVSYKGNIAQLKAYARGLGTGTINSSTVNVQFRFSFMPATDRYYCIRPIVFMNGHWLVWTWGTCGGTPEDRGNGVARLKLKVQVDQASVPVATKEHLIFEQIVAAGVDKESGFGYDSEVDGGASLGVYLEGGHEAIIWVGCEAFAQIENHGSAWVDMKSSPYFGFSIDQVRWGWHSCFPWWLTSKAIPITIPYAP